MNGPEILTLQSIPLEVFQDLEADGWKICLDTYDYPINEDTHCTTRKTNHVTYGPIEKYNIVMDPYTFAPQLVENAIPVYSYVIRGVFDESEKTLDLYRVYTVKAIQQTPETIVHTEQAMVEKMMKKMKNEKQ